MDIDFKLPELGENIHQGDVVNVLVHEGDTIAANDGVVELETDKAVVEIPCPHAGRVAKLHVRKGETVAVGQTLLTVAAAEPAAAKPQAAARAAAKPQAAAAAAPADEPSVAAESLPAGPAARRLARELGVDLARVPGSGRHGRILPEDVERAAGPAAAGSAAAAAGPAGSAPPPQPVVPPGEPGQDAWGPVRREPLSRIRRTIAEQMARSAQIIPHVTNFDDADVTDLDRLRQQVPAGQLGPNVKLTLMPLAMKAVALALRRHPLLNSSLDQEHDQIVYKQYVSLGVAVDTPRGLIVPVVRDADRLTIVELARTLASIAERVRAGQFAVEDLRGGTFTISNLGAVGGTYSTPIINHPEVAVLLVGRARWLPMVRGECHHRTEPRRMLPLSLSYDHRLVDGATAARFLNDVIGSLEAPGALLLG
ncbi:MAG: dihydrolipoamide acetyltransferase family protein [Thermoguttaceae bacterium]|jgi:pyruvate dehydrogenase complex dihydrolipoamide acetyltransferase long form